MLASIDFYFFSPTGGTKKAGELFCKSIARNINYIDLTVPKSSYGEAKSDVAQANQEIRQRAVGEIHNLLVFSNFFAMLVRAIIH